MKKSLLTLVGCLLLTSLCFATGTKENKKTTETRIFIDSFGREVEIPTEIKTYAPSGPLSQFILYTVAPEKMGTIARQWSSSAKEFISKEYLDIPMTGQFYGSGNLNREALAAANPDVIIDIGQAKKSGKEDMEKLQAQLGIPCIYIEGTLETMDECYAILGSLLDCEKRAQRAGTFCKDLVTTVKTTMATIEKKDEKKKVMYCLNPEGTNILPKNSFQAEMLDMMVENAAVVEKPSHSGKGSKSSFEQYYLWNPDIIIFEREEAYKEASIDKRWAELKAIQKEAYLKVPEGPFNWVANPPSINRYLGMLWLGKVLYPSYFSYDLYEKTAEYYDIFYNYTLTKEKFIDLLEHAQKEL